MPLLNLPRAAKPQHPTCCKIISSPTGRSQKKLHNSAPQMSLLREVMLICLPAKENFPVKCLQDSNNFCFRRAMRRSMTTVDQNHSPTWTSTWECTCQIRAHCTIYRTHLTTYQIRATTIPVCYESLVFSNEFRWDAVKVETSALSHSRAASHSTHAARVSGKQDNARRAQPRKARH